MPRDFDKFLQASGGWLSEEEKQKARQIWPDRASQIDALPTQKFMSEMQTMEQRMPKPEIRGQQLQPVYTQPAKPKGFFESLQEKVGQHEQMYENKSVPEKFLGGVLRFPATATLFNKKLATKPQEAIPELGKSLLKGGYDLASLIRAGAEASNPSNLGKVDPYTKQEVERIASELEQRPFEKFLELTALPAIVIPFVKSGIKLMEGRSGIIESPRAPIKPVPTEAQLKGLQENVAWASEKGVFDKANPQPLQPWYRGKISEKSNGDTFWTTDKSIAEDFGKQKVGDVPTVDILTKKDYPKNIYRTGSKETLAEELGINGDPYMMGSKFDDAVKSKLSKKGYDAILYNEGTLGAKELHLFKSESGISFINKNVQKKIQADLGQKSNLQKMMETDKAYERQAKSDQMTLFEAQYRLDQKYLNDAKWSEKYGNWPRNTKTPPPVNSDIYASFLGINPADMQALGITIKQGARMGMHAAKTLTDLAGAIFKQSRNRVTLPESRGIISQIDAVFRQSGRRTGQAYEKYLESGIKNLTNDQAMELHQELQYKPPPKARGKDVALDVLKEIKHREKYGTKSQDLEVLSVADGMQQIFEDFGKEAERLGVMIKNPDGTLRPFQRVGAYAPRMVQRSIVETMAKDINEILKQAEKMDDPAFERYVQNAIQTRTGLRPETIEALQYIIENNGSVNMRDAIMFAFRRLYDEQFVPMGNLERGRLTEFPAHFYETDPRVYVPAYIRGASKRLSEIEMWGQSAEKIMSKIADIAIKDPKEAEIIQGILETFTGASEIKNALSPGLGKVVSGFSSYEVLTKIGLGWATVPNITQPLVSSFAKLGWIRNFKGIGNLLTKNGWKEIGESGAIADDVMNMLSGQNTLSGKMGRVAELSLKASLFDGINRWNKALTASSGKYYIQDLYKAAQKDNLYGRWAAKELAEIGVDYTKPLTKDIRLEGMYDLAQNLQLMKNITKEPLWFNNPKTRVLALFKRFAYRQATLMKDMLVKDLIQRKNPMPMLRLIAGGYIGGEFVGWAKDEIKKFLTGKKEPDINENIWQHAINNFAAAGTMGVFSDIFGRLGDYEMLPDAVENALGSIDFAVTPIPISEAEKFTANLYAMVRYWKQQNKYTGNLMEATERTVKAAPYPLSRMVGAPIVRMVGEQLKTDRQKQAALDKQYSDMRQKIMNRFLKKDFTGGKDLIRAWNQAHPERQIRIKASDVKQERDRRKKQSLQY